MEGTRPQGGEAAVYAAATRLTACAPRPEFATVRRRRLRAGTAGRKRREERGRAQRANERAQPARPGAQRPKWGLSLDRERSSVKGGEPSGEGGCGVPARSVAVARSAAEQVNRGRQRRPVACPLRARADGADGVPRERGFSRAPPGAWRQEIDQLHPRPGSRKASPPCPTFARESGCGSREARRHAAKFRRYRLGPDPAVAARKGGLFLALRISAIVDGCFSLIVDGVSA